MKKATIYDVASSAGVSTATVSRYLNRTSYIAKEKVDAIESAIFETGFKPKKRKTSTSKLRTMKIGLLVPSYDSPFVHALITGIYSVISKSSYELLVEVTMWKKEIEVKKLDYLLSCNVDALIVVGGYQTEENIKKKLNGLPVLLLFREPEMLLPNINIDNELGGYLATTHLIQNGHRKIVHVKGIEKNIESIKRFVGYKRALATAGIKFDSDLVIDGDFELKAAMENTCELINKGHEFTAIFASNDLSAIGAVQALAKYNKSVPNDVSVIGYDDLPICDYYLPRLTTIKQPFEKIGKIAIKTVLDLISSNYNKYELPPIEVIARDSVKLND